MLLDIFAVLTCKVAVGGTVTPVRPSRSAFSAPCRCPGSSISVVHVEGDLWRQPAENGRRSKPGWWPMGNRSSPSCPRARRSAHYGPRRRDTKQASPSRRAFHTHDGQVASAGCEVNVDLDSRTGPAFYQGDGLCTNRGSWPTFTRFVARFAIGRIAAGIDFIRRPSAQRHVWPMLVVPINRQADFAAEGALAKDTSGKQRRSVRINRSMTARLPCLPIAPYRGGSIPVRLHQRLKASQSN